MSAQYTVAEFCDAVSRMRECQRRFFETRDKNIIPTAKMLEKRTDAILESAKQFGFKGGVK